LALTTFADRRDAEEAITPQHYVFLISGRGVYFPDPNGHWLEITRPYGSG
jgi:hypothetical protein